MEKPPGLALCHIHFKSTTISQATQIWQLDLEKCSDLIFPRILITLIYQDRYPNFGESGIFLLERGSESMFIFRLEVIETEQSVPI